MEKIKNYKFKVGYKTKVDSFILKYYPTFSGYNISQHQRALKKEER